MAMTTSLGGAVTRPETDLMSEPDGDKDAAKGRKLARSAWLTFEVDDDGDVREALGRRAARVASSFGGYIATQSARGFTMRVPAADLDKAMQALEKLAEVSDRGYRVDDVSRRHRDLTVRLENARKLKARLLELVDKTENVEAILAVEKELARVTVELETLEAEMRGLDQRVALATIDVHYEDAVSPGPVGWLFYGAYRGVKWLFVWD